jgi:hypothetical protein
MSAAADTKTTAVKPTVLKDVSCDYCTKPIRDCECLALPADGLYCDGVCGVCHAKSYECVCPCATCKYPADACRCDEEYESHPDALCCPHCYSDPCECEADAKQRDLNASKEYDCPRCGNDVKQCRCGRKSYDSDDE